MASPSGSRLARAFLGYLLGVVVLVTLVPFDFTFAGPHRLQWGGGAGDAIANIAMFVPLGFLFRLISQPSGDRWALRPLAWALLFSGLIEATQLFLPVRFSSPLDVATNGLGAWLGAIAQDVLARRIRVTPTLVGALALELPLMGLVYLLIPLLWLSGLAAVDDPARLTLSLLLGLIGAIVLGAIHRFRLAPAGAASATRFAALGAAWYLIGAIPGLIEHPLLALPTALLVGGATRVCASGGPIPDGQRERRFETGTLRRLVPVLMVYLLGVAAWPPWAAMSPWRAEAGLSGFWGAADTERILQVLERLSAFTVLGYVIAEYRGRRERSFQQSLATFAGWGAAASSLLEVIAGFHAGAGASLLRGVLSVGTAVYGAGIYHLQRTQIRWLLAPGAAAISPGPPEPGPGPAADPARSARSAGPASAGRTD